MALWCMAHLYMTFAIGVLAILAVHSVAVQIARAIGNVKYTQDRYVKPPQKSTETGLESTGEPET